MPWQGPSARALLVALSAVSLALRTSPAQAPASASVIDGYISDADLAPMRQTEFYERGNAGIGHSMNADETDRRNSPWTMELLRTFVGVRFKNDAIAVNSRAGIARDCPFRFFVDGIPKSAPVNIDHDLPSSKDLAGIEVFTSIATVPPMYHGRRGCVRGDPAVDEGRRAIRRALRSRHANAARQPGTPRHIRPMDRG